jgi:hypothetical protein
MEIKTNIDVYRNSAVFLVVLLKTPFFLATSLEVRDGNILLGPLWT